MLIRALFAVVSVICVSLATYFRIQHGSAGVVLTAISVPCMFYLMLYSVDMYNKILRQHMHRVNLRRGRDRWKL